VTFHNFHLGTWTVNVIQGSKSAVAGSARVPESVTYQQSFATPQPVDSFVDAYVYVCPNTGGSCLRSATVRVDA
jgi:hypothetical protein